MRLGEQIRRKEWATRRRGVAVALCLGFSLTAATVLAAPPPTPRAAPAARVEAQQQEDQRGRGDDLSRVRRWRSFLDRANRAFFAAHMSTEAVKSKIDQADERIAALEAAPADDPGGRSDITGDVGFLERALRAFTAAHMNTADAQRWLDEAKEAG